MKYDAVMDPQCFPICDAINRIPGVRTLESCCGHGKHPFRVWLDFEGEEGYKNLAILLYHLDP